MIDIDFYQDAVRAFHSAAGHPNPLRYKPEEVRRELRAALILEEALEVVEALGLDAAVMPSNTADMLPHAAKARFKIAGDSHAFAIGEPRSEPNWAEVIDGLCDLLYVTFGTAVEMGVPLDTFFEAVHRANMAKLGGPTREDGKSLKPEGWKPPDIAGRLEALVRRQSGEEIEVSIPLICSEREAGRREAAEYLLRLASDVGCPFDSPCPDCGGEPAPEEGCDTCEGFGAVEDVLEALLDLDANAPPGEVR